MIKLMLLGSVATLAACSTAPIRCDRTLPEFQRSYTCQGVPYDRTGETRSIASEPTAPGGGGNENPGGGNVR